MSGTQRMRRARQFSVRELLLVTCAAALLFALHRWYGWLGSVLGLWLLLLVAAHVMANAWGSRIPAASVPRPGDSPPDDGTSDSRRPIPRPNTPATRLGYDMAFARHWAITSAACAALGAIATITALVWLAPSIGPTGIVFGGLSAAVIGGWAGFLGVSFVDVARQAWSEAAGTQSRSETPQPGGVP